MDSTIAELINASSFISVDVNRWFYFRILSLHWTFFHYLTASILNKMLLKLVLLVSNVLILIGYYAVLCTIYYITLYNDLFIIQLK